MMIRPYQGLPRAYTPDVGEVVEARRTPVDRFVRAVVVLRPRRRRDGRIRVRVQWLDSDDQAGVDADEQLRSPIRAGDVGWLIMPDGPGDLPLIRQVDRA